MLNTQQAWPMGSQTTPDVLQAIIDFLPSGVSLFDRELNMVLCNRQLRELLEFPDALFENGLPSLLDLARFNARRGEYGPGDPEQIAESVVARAREREPHVFERKRPNGRILEIRGNPLPDGGFVTIYTDITERKNAEEEARRSANYLDAVVNALPQGVSVVNEALDVVLWNRAFVKQLNLPEDFMKPGRTFADVIRFNAQRGEYGDVDPEEKVREMVELARRFERHRMERRRSDGGVMEIEGRIVFEGEQPVGFVTTYTDITDRLRNAETVRRVRDLMSDAVNFSPTYIWETGPDGHYTFAQGMEKILGRADDEVLGTERWKQFCTEHCGKPCIGSEVACQWLSPIHVHAVLERCTLFTHSADGRPVWLSSSAQPVFDEGGCFNGYRGVDVDITELTLAQQELEQMALHDPMTGLANRRKFCSRYDLELARQSGTGNPLALLLVDVDHFKSINDRFGHLVGDECLRRIANLLSSALRVTDLVGRFGGEEFMVLLSDTDPEEALQVAETLRRVVEASSLGTPEGDPLAITVSIGVAARPASDRRDFEQVLTEADRGVYAAKHAGRNCVCAGWNAPAEA